MWPWYWIMFYSLVDCKKPHIVVVIGDDVGWANVGWHLNSTSTRRHITSPLLNQLAYQGVILDRHYGAPFCSPSRCSFQSGRLAARFLNTNVMPENMTTLAEKLKSVGYKTHMIGKWHMGSATPAQLPLAHGYDTFFGFYSGINDAWTYKNNYCSCGTDCLTDLWNSTQPVTTPPSKHEEYLFRDALLNLVNQHNPDNPLFLVYASRMAHAHLNVPDIYTNEFHFGEMDMYSSQCCRDQNLVSQTNVETSILEKQCENFDMTFRGLQRSNTTQVQCGCRSALNGMVDFLDTNVQLLYRALVKKNMWSNTLFLFTSDNGGNTGVGASNYPLRGGKGTIFEGGIRVPAFLSGGFLPQRVRGTILKEMISMADWYHTFAFLANVDPTDSKAHESGLPPIDSLNMWPLLSGETSISPRTFYYYQNIYIENQYKLMVEKNRGNVLAGPKFPNSTSIFYTALVLNQPNIPGPINCIVPCLFDLKEDLFESHDISHNHNALSLSLYQKYQAITSHFNLPFNYTKKGINMTACSMATEHYGGVFGPWLEITPDWLRYYNIT